MKIGILGGGQLGKMLYNPAIKMDMDVCFMDNMSEGPVAQITKDYTLGTITEYDDVMAFGSDCDVVSIEIEKVNTDALKQLEAAGKQVFPQPHVLETIQDKSLQKQFYLDNDLPTSRFKSYQNVHELREDIANGVWSFPFVQKLRKDGYDGRGVTIIRSAEDLEKAFPTNFLVEAMVPIEKEIGVVTCRNAEGEIVIYDPVEMVFHADANILLYQLAPAIVDEAVAQRAIDLAKATSEAFGIVGLLAIELFLSKDGDVLINECAPRPHNSGHHTIEATLCSQYENQMRTLAGLPLGAPDTICPSLLMNILGDEGHTGPVHYQGLKHILKIPGVNVHLYGKTTTKPFRKMGHINIVGKDQTELIKHYNYISNTLRVVTK